MKFHRYATFDQIALLKLFFKCWKCYQTGIWSLNELIMKRYWRENIQLGSLTHLNRDMVKCPNTDSTHMYEHITFYKPIWNMSALKTLILSEKS